MVLYIVGSMLCGLVHHGEFAVWSCILWECVVFFLHCGSVKRGLVHCGECAV